MLRTFFSVSALSASTLSAASGVLFLTSPAKCQVPQTPAAIAGRLTTNDSMPLVGARVFLAGSGVVVAADSNGRFVIPSPPAGVFAIELSHPGFETIQIPPIRMPSSDTLAITAMLKRAPRPGREADSVRAADAMRGGRGQSTAPAMLIDGVFVRPQLRSDTVRGKTPAELEIVSILILTGNPAMVMYGGQYRFGIISINTLWPCTPQMVSAGRRCKAGE